MAFTMVTITHTFLNEDGTAAAGSVRFSLSGRMTNGTSTIEAAEPVTSVLNGSGQLSQTLPANNDPTTSPSDTHWDVTIMVTGARTEEYAIVIPYNQGSTVDLGSLLPDQSQVE